jgi:membrane-associated HD superfamily phosphohydrolase
MPKLYLCSELNCNKKYITQKKLIAHLLNVHEIVKDDIADPVEITNENKKTEETKKNKIKREEEIEEKKKEIEKRNQLKLKAKLEAEEEYKQEQFEKYKSLEENKLQLLQEQKKLDKKWISMIKLIQNRTEKNSLNCSICVDNLADTACVPCGHKNFCYKCIDDYFKTYGEKGCPVCRAEIITIVKIYS